MKIKEKKDLHTKNIVELRKFLKVTQTELFTARLDKEQNKLKNTQSIFHLGKKIAIIKTILNLKAGEEAKASI